MSEPIVYSTVRTGANWDDTVGVGIIERPEQQTENGRVPAYRAVSLLVTTEGSLSPIEANLDAGEARVAARILLEHADKLDALEAAADG